MQSAMESLSMPGLSIVFLTGNKACLHGIRPRSSKNPHPRSHKNLAARYNPGRPPQDYYSSFLDVLELSLLLRLLARHPRLRMTRKHAAAISGGPPANHRGRQQLT